MDGKYIVFTHEFIRCKSLTFQEKIMYLEIASLSSTELGCIASNGHFEKCFGISKKSASNTISSLIKKGFIESKLTNRNHTRILSIKNGLVSTEDGGVSIKDGETIDTKTLNKTLNKSTSSKSEDYLLKNKLYLQLSDIEKELYQEYLSIRKSMKVKTTPKIHDRLLDKYFEYGRNTLVIEKAITGNWKDFYNINNTNSNNTKQPQEHYSQSRGYIV